MGLDGGTIATRTDILRGSSWRLANADAGAARSTRGGQLGGAGSLYVGERRDAQQAAVDGWRQCAVSGAALTPQASIVACELGRLYLRDAVIEYLTSSGQFSEESHCGDLSAVRVEFAHIERLKDVFRVQLTPSDAPSREACAGHDEEQLARHAGPWACPVDRAVTTNGQHAFVALRPCGHVMRERVAAELFAELVPGSKARVGASSSAGSASGGAPSDRRCPVCSEAVDAIVGLFPQGDEAAARHAAVAAAREERRSARKRRRKGAEPDNAT